MEGPPTSPVPNPPSNLHTPSRDVNENSGDAIDRHDKVYADNDDDNKDYDERYTHITWDELDALNDDDILRLLIPDEDAFLAKVDYLRMPHQNKKLALATKIIHGMIRSTDWNAVEDYTFLLAILDVTAVRLNERVIALNALPRMIELAQMGDRPGVQHWACRAVAAFAEGTEKHKRHLVELGIIPILIKLLIESRDDNVISWVLIAVDEILYDHGQHCAQAIELGILPALVSLLGRDFPEPIAEWLDDCLLTVLRYFPCRRPMETAIWNLPALKKIISDPTVNVNTATDACWVLLRLTHESKKPLTKKLVKLGIVSDLVKIAKKSNKFALLFPAVRILKSICTQYPHLVVANQVLPTFAKLLSRTRSNDFVNPILQALTNLSKCDRNFIEMMANEHFINSIIHLLRCHGVYIRYETTLCLHVMISHIRDRSASGLLPLIFNSLLDPLGEILKDEHAPREQTKLVLAILTKIMKLAETIGENEAVCESFINRKIICTLENMQWSGDDSVSEDVKILTEIWYRLSLNADKGAS